jgi:hypothetical protein
MLRRELKWLKFHAEVKNPSKKLTGSVKQLLVMLKKI